MLASRLRCSRCHHCPTPASLSWTTVTIDNDDAVRPKNVPWNWPRPSIGMTAKAKGRRRSVGVAVLASGLATTTMSPALRLDDGTVLDHAVPVRARAILSPQQRQCRGGQGQWRMRRQRRYPRPSQEKRKTQQGKCASCNGSQSAGLRKAGVPAPAGGGGVAEQHNGNG